jgi:ABC-type transport system substrate-binding protein
MSPRTSLLRVTLAAAAIALVASCAPRSSLPRPHAVWVVGADAPAFDPGGPPDFRRAAIARLLTHGLVEEDTTGRVVAAAADSIGISDDSLLYTFRLRPGLTFVDGSLCRSADFRAALVRGLARTDHSTARWQLAALRGVDAIRAGRALPALGIETPDSSTLRLRLATPDPLLLRKLALPGTSDAWRAPASGGWSGAVGLGPYRVLHADSVRSLVLIRAHSARDRGDLADTLSVRFAPNAARVRSFLRAGKADLVWPLPPNFMHEALPAGYRAVSQDARPARWLVLVMRADVPPLSRLPARHALAHGINRAEVLRSLGIRPGEFGPWLDGAPPFEFPRLDPQEIESWRERGKLGRSFHVVMAYDAYGPAAEVARAMQGEWSAHAIYVELTPLAGERRTRELLGGQAHAVLADVQGLLPDPLGLAGYVMPLRGPAVGPVRTGWRTRDFDRWILPARRGSPWDPAWAQHRFEEERIVLPLARLPWTWIERAAGPVAPFHPRYGPECPTPAVPR